MLFHAPFGVSFIINSLSNMKKTNRKWTAEEDAIALRYIRNNVNNLHKSFILISEHLTDMGSPRTPSAVEGHWYTVLSKKQNALCFFTASSKHVAKNRKNGAGVESNQSIWHRLLTVLRSLKG